MDSLTEHSRFVVDSSWRRPANGAVVIAGSPIKIFRLGRDGQKIATLLENGEPLPVGHQPLTDRLLDAGAIHRSVSAEDDAGFQLADVTVVVPAYVRSATDATQLSNLVAQCAGAYQVVVVDDDSPHALPNLGDARVISLTTNGGPGSARNAGLAVVSTPLVAFIDLDVTISNVTLSGLIPYFADKRLGIVAPRIACTPSGNAIGEYEQIRSPLDLGTKQARVEPRSRVSYVPSALWLCRTEAIRAVQGFDGSLRVGEDVDALWRVISTGWRCRYQPEIAVNHRSRATMHEFISQRRLYGRSAATLAARHRGDVAPVRVSAYSAGMWISIGCGFPILGTLVGAYTVIALARKLRDVPNSLLESLRLAGLGNLHAARLIASAITRAWWPIAVILALVSRRARTVLLASAVVPTMYEWWSARPALDPLRYLALRLIDDASYGVGVWEGVIARRSAEALKPDVSSWSKH